MTLIMKRNNKEGKKSEDIQLGKDTKTIVGKNKKTQAKKERLPASSDPKMQKIYAEMAKTAAPLVLTKQNSRSGGKPSIPDRPLSLSDKRFILDLIDDMNANSEEQCPLHWEPDRVKQFEDILEKECHVVGDLSDYFTHVVNYDFIDPYQQSWKILELFLGEIKPKTIERFTKYE